MKVIINVEIELDDEYVQEWNKRYQDYHTKLYGSEEKGKQALEENPIESGLATSIEDLIINYEEGILECNAKVIETKKKE